MHSPYFRQEEFEQAIYKCLTYGLVNDIAEAIDAGYGVVSQYFSPDNLRQSPLFKAATLFAAWMEKDPEGAECAFATFEAFIRRAKATEITLDLPAARRASHKERSEFYIAEAENKPTETRIRELRESIVADQRLLESLEDEDRRERQRNAFPGARVNHRAAAVGKRIVTAGRKG